MSVIPKQVIGSLIISGLVTLGIMKWQHEKEKLENDKSLESERHHPSVNVEPNGYPSEIPETSIVESSIVESIHESVESSDEESVDGTQTAYDEDLVTDPKLLLMETLGIDQNKINELKGEIDQLKEYLDDCILEAVNNPIVNVSMKEIRK